MTIRLAGLILLSAFSFRVWAFNIECSKSDIQLNEQAAKVGCQIQDIAQQINAGNEVVPSVIFHYGEKKYLEEDAEAGTIPQDACDKFVMGGATRYHLGDIRRGLYGTSGIDTNHFGGGKYNWLMEIHIKPECRKPENVVTFYNLTESKRFLDWYQALPADKKTFASVGEFKNTCFQPGGLPLMGYTGVFMNPGNCATFLSAYIDSTQAKVVQDTFINKAFYLRDRSCIETIKGTPEDVIEFAAKRQLLWVSSCKYYGQPTIFANIVLNALKDYKKEVPANVLGRLKENFKLGHVPTDGIDAFERCQASGSLDTYRAVVNEWVISSQLHEACR